MGIAPLSAQGLGGVAGLRFGGAALECAFFLDYGLYAGVCGGLLSVITVAQAWLANIAGEILGQLQRLEQQLANPTLRR